MSLRLDKPLQTEVETSQKIPSQYILIPKPLALIMYQNLHDGSTLKRKCRILMTLRAMSKFMGSIKITLLLTVENSKRIPTSCALRSSMKKAKESIYALSISRSSLIRVQIQQPDQSYLANSNSSLRTSLQAAGITSTLIVG